LGLSKVLLLPLLCIVNAQHQQPFTHFVSGSPARGNVPVRLVQQHRAAPQVVRVPTPTFFRTPSQQPAVPQVVRVQTPTVFRTPASSAPLTRTALKTDVISRTRDTVNSILESAQEAQSNPELASLFDFNFDASANGGYVYDPENPNKPWSYNYTYDPASSNSFRGADLGSEYVVDTLIDQGEKIMKAVDVLAGNKLLGQLLSSTSKSDDPCAVAPEELSYVVRDLVEGIASSRAELVSILNSVVSIQGDQKNIPKIARAASEAVASVDPLLPKFSSILKTNKACEDSLKTTANSLNNIGSGLDALSKTNSFGATSFAQGAKASQAFSQFAEKFSNGPLTTTCEDSPTFTSDVFIGVSDLIEGLSEITKSFAGNAPAASTRQVDETVVLLKDGAEILSEANLTPLVTGLVKTNDGCKTSLPAVAKALAEVADIAEAFDITIAE
jgi:hypothetical protein